MGRTSNDNTLLPEGQRYKPLKNPMNVAHGWPV